MNRSFLSSTLTLFLLAASVAAQGVEPPAPPNVQDPQPQQEERQEPQVVRLGDTVRATITLTDIDGIDHSTEDLAGKIVVVNFWSTRCPIMRGWESRYAAIHREYAERGVVFVTINANVGNGELQREGAARGAPAEPTEAEAKQPYPEIRAYLRANELPYTVLVDAECKVADLLQAKTTPDIFVFDGTGKLVYRGLIDDDLRQQKGEKAKHYLRDVLDVLLDEQKAKEFEPFETRPEGCSIKRPAGEARRPRRGGR
ncbi:MAG: redoxin domain-containing protein [Planctomycetes bacterium]|nr:redoxin domain-containing protein [Planctomycetota bacterium]